MSDFEMLSIIIQIAILIIEVVRLTKKDNHPSKRK